MQEYGKITWIIGDIHGMYDPLRVLIDNLDDELLDKFVFVGDYIDYGPSSKEVLDLIMGLGDKAVCLMGNHEYLLLETLYDEQHRNSFGYAVWQNNGAERTIRSFGCQTFQEFEQKFEQKYADFLLNLNLFHLETVTCVDKEFKFLITHAGIMPNIPLEEQLAVNSYHDFKQFLEEKRVWIEDAFIWVRKDFLTCDPDKWSEYMIIHGHTPTHLLNRYIPGFSSDELEDLPYLRKHPDNSECIVSIDIDTGAAFGNCLTAIGLMPTKDGDRSYPTLIIKQLHIKEGYYRRIPIHSRLIKLECDCVSWQDDAM